MIDERDIQKITYTNNTDVTSMRLHHIPTKITVKGEGKGQRRLYKSLLAQLQQEIEKVGAKNG